MLSNNKKTYENIQHIHKSKLVKVKRLEYSRIVMWWSVNHKTLL